MRKPLIICTASVAIGMLAPVAMATETTVASLDNPNGPVTVAAGDTLIVTGNVTSTGDDTSTRFNKAGDGTLVLKGNNTFKRIGQSAGTLVFDGGATTVSGGTGTGIATTEANVDFRGSGSKTEFRGGATFTMSSDNGYAGFFATETVISNATVDATALKNELLNGFSGQNSSGGIMTIGEGGHLKIGTMRVHQNSTAANANKYGLRIVDGGILDLRGDKTKKGPVLDGAKYGFLEINGGIVENNRTAALIFPNYVQGSEESSQANVEANWANTPITIGENGATIRNATTKSLRLRAPLRSGAAADGGLHLEGKGLVYLDSQNFFNGGLYLDSNEGMLFAPERERAFGAVPETPCDNIFVRGSSTALFGEPNNLELHANRNVLVSSNCTFNVIAKAGKTLTIHGEINGEHEPGALPTKTRMVSTWQWTPIGGSGWKGGLVVLDPGEGSTNNVGRLTVEGNTEIKSGTTLACAPTSGVTGANAPVWVNGTGVTADDGVCGVLTVSGGTLAIATNATAKGRYFQVDGRGRVDVCGGRIETGGGEYLNALNSYGLTTIRDGGVIDCGDGKFRVVQTVGDNATVVRLATNGLLRCSQLSLDFNKRPEATFLFDGGYLQTTVDNSFCAKGLDAAWDGITFAVGPGGAGFDVPAGSNIYIYRPLVSGVAEDETDGGLMVRGSAGTAVCLMTAQFYNGPTTIDSIELQQRSGDNLLPKGTDIVLKDGGILALWTYGQGGGAARATEATLGGVSGDGTVRYATAATFDGTFAPSIGGTIRFLEAPKSISGTLEIAGDETGVMFGENQDISGLTLNIADTFTFDDSKRYKIVDAPKGVTGEFKEVHGLPSSDWKVKYAKDGVYVYRRKGLLLIIW